MKLRLREKVHPYLSIAVLVWAVAMAVVVSYVQYDFTVVEQDQRYFLSSQHRQEAAEKQEHNASSSERR